MQPGTPQYGIPFPGTFFVDRAGRVTARVVRDVTIARDAAVRPLVDPEGRLTIEGALKYQACDDRICYPPETVPVRWTLQVEAHDRERAPAEMQRKPR